MKIKYDRHLKLYKKLSSNSDKLNWLNNNSLDHYRHLRIKSLIKPLIQLSKRRKWLTVGDGRYGTDANYLLNSGVKEVHASDISDALLKIGKKKNFINDYSSQNAEHLGFEDDSYDYLLCKESYHHFPRPNIALYEMIRVAKEACILIEPLEPKKNFLLKNSSKYEFEEVGNFVYTVSPSEIEKIMLGIGLKYYALKGINDYYFNGVEEVLTNGKSNIKDKILIFRFQLIILIKNILTLFGFKNWNLISIIIFKKKPSNKVRNQLIKNNFKIKTLPDNPYS